MARQPSAQYDFGPANGGGDIIHLRNSQNQIVGYVDQAGNLNFDGATVTLTYNTSSNFFQLVRNDGQFSAVLAVLNAATPGFPNAPTSYHEISVNSDGQTNYTTFTLGAGFPTNKSSELVLDQDGHMSLAAGAGGGISTDLNTGETCIPYTVAGGGPVANAFRINTSGVVSKYLGVATAGFGISTIVGLTHSTGLNGNIGPVTLYTTASGSGYAASGLYRVAGTMIAAAPVGGATMQVTVNYTDSVQANSQTTGAQTFAATGATVSFNFIFEAVSSSAITITLTTAHTNYNGRTVTTTMSGP